LPQDEGKQAAHLGDRPANIIKQDSSFSEEKEAKRLLFSGTRGKIPAMASNGGAAEKKKFFGSFFQKRTPSFLSYPTAFGR
jgi:hypothetical protein